MNPMLVMTRLHVPCLITRKSLSHLLQYRLQLLRIPNHCDGSEEYYEGEAEDEEGTDDQDVSSDWEPETPGTELGRSGLGFHHHFCHSEHNHGNAVCRHNVNVALPR